MEFQHSQTMANLLAALAGEAQAAAKYGWYAEKAKQEHLRPAAELFEKTAENELQHGKIWYELLHDGIGTTAQNLTLAADGEQFEHSRMYPEFAETARKEGFDRIAFLFEEVGRIEKSHEVRFRALEQALTGGKLFRNGPETVWVCAACGHRTVGEQPPEQCPVCGHPKDFFQPQKS